MSRRGDVLAIDRDLEARKHLWLGLARLMPRMRVAFLREVCASCAGPLKARVSSSTGKVGEVYHDLMQLSVGYGVNLYDVCERMEKWLRHGDRCDKFIAAHEGRDSHTVNREFDRVRREREVGHRS